MYYPPDLAILRVRSSMAFLTPYTVLIRSTGFGLLFGRAKSGWRPRPPARAPAKTLRFFGSQSLLRFIAELMDSKPERRNSWVKKRCGSGDANRCWRCLQKSNRGCCRKSQEACYLRQTRVLGVLSEGRMWRCGGSSSSSAMAVQSQSQVDAKGRCCWIWVRRGGAEARYGSSAEGGTEEQEDPACEVPQGQAGECARYVPSQSSIAV